mmetsp:Transcript_20781/g.32552  ORF Transcript_20781/g.32552 Transcript_20781/m.32552 type:complete len:117 (-) Transcript_20781:169-519(-)
MSLEQAQIQLKELGASWTVNENGTEIRRTFVAKNFVASMAFLNKVAEIAEAEGHHPDLHLVSYREVTVVCATHSIGGLHLNDFILAAKIDGVPVEYSPKWAKEHPEKAINPMPKDS